MAVLGLDESRIARVREQGADYALDGRSAEVKDVAHSLGAGNGPDVVVDTVGTYGSLAQAIELAGVGGRVGLFGGGDREVTVPSGAILGKELDVLGLLSSSGAWGRGRRPSLVGQAPPRAHDQRRHATRRARGGVSQEGEPRLERGQAGHHSVGAAT